jgi:hypothetical protein
MAVVTLKLRDQYDMFVFPSVGASLNFESPSIQIDSDKLSKQDLAALGVAIRMNRILAEGMPAVQPVTPVVPAPIIPKPVTLKPAPQPTISIEQAYVTKRAREEQLVSLLRHSLKDVTVHISEITNIADLKFLLNAEKRGKKRKGILKVINQKMAAAEKSIIAAIEEDPGMVLPKEKKIFDIEEEPGEMVTISIGE